MDEKKVTYPGVIIEEGGNSTENADLRPSAPLSRAHVEMQEANGSLYKDKGIARVKKTIENGESEFRQVGRVETKAFDAKFLEALEKGLEAVGRILANPRTFIKEQTELENVEKAKKVSTVSIQHFATHSQYLRTITESGEVIPDKILTVHSETNTAIYENRFVMTLIKRAISFIEQRYNYVRDHGETRDSDELTVTNKTDFSGVTYEVSMRVRASVPSSDGGNSRKNEEILQRLAMCRQRCGDYLHSNFMTQMKGAKDVTSPVHMTNMLLKHPDYHAAYELWEFIESYETLGVSYEVQETALAFDEEYMSELYELMTEAVVKLRSRHVGKAAPDELTKTKTVTPKVVFTLDDLNYDDSKFLYDAFPESAEEPTAADLIDEDRRKKVVQERLSHIAGEEIATVKLRKNIAKDKDRIAFEGAKSRDQKKAVLEDEIAARRKKEEEIEAARRAEEEKEAKRLEEEKRRLEEERYLREKKRLGGN